MLLRFGEAGRGTNVARPRSDADTITTISYYIIMMDVLIVLVGRLVELASGRVRKFV